MDNLMSFDDLLNKLKSTNENTSAVADIIEVEEAVANIIHCIAKARIKQGLTRAELAEACGLTQTKITNIENLNTIPKLDTIVEIALKVGIRLVALPAGKEHNIKTEGK